MAAALALPLVASTNAGATAAAQVSRLFGSDRIGTAVAVSQNGWAAGAAQAVVLARSDSFPDALAGTPLAVAKGGPLLLTPTAGLDPNAASELTRVLPKGGTVYLLGGTAALSDQVASTVSGLGYQVIRYGGVDRFQTAVIIDRAIGKPQSIFEATGLSFPYALIAGVAAAHLQSVVVLTSDSTMPSATQQYLSENTSVARFAVGPQAAAADPTAAPIAGSDEYDTARLLASTFFNAPAQVAVASGTNFPDALSGGAHIGHLGGPLLLTDPNSLSPQIQSYLTANSPTVNTAFIYGGTAAVSAAVGSAVQSAVTGHNTTGSGGGGQPATFGDGTYQVGKNLAAGTYRTRQDAPGCYWQRLSGFSGQLTDIIANNLSGYHQVVTVAPTDLGFSTQGCGTWTADLSPITTSPTAPFGSGTWIVNTDISPGTWTAPGGTSCYWERLSGFSGQTSDIIANDLGPTGPVVTISSSDAGFASDSCGTWTKIG